MSSDPKPREGTETRGADQRPPHPVGRQTQNPERGRKLPRRLAITTPTNGRQTQNPERGRKLLTMRLPRALFQLSSDPKPREGTETRGADQRPPHPVGRQTQNPERGRKLVRHLCLIQVQCPVVRPKTPRGDGNILSANSSTVPLSGRQTQNPERGRKPSWWDMDERDYRGRRTQNPERGRKLDAESHRVREVQRSSDPKPREGTETHIARHTTATLLLHVLRPKTPRGDGNTPPMTAMSE
ncbi:Uncharacterised protein [Mycobacterium tuberculosis]|nr:Uncharacterised protein [Mycobacterium tuberculosis]